MQSVLSHFETLPVTNGRNPCSCSEQCKSRVFIGLKEFVIIITDKQLMSLSGVIGARDRVFSPNTGQQKQAKFSQEVN